MVKPAYGEPIDNATYVKTLDYFDKLLRMLHPFMPFITEELWQHLAERKEGESIMYAPMPVAGNVNAELLNNIEYAKEVIAGVRGVRASKNIPQKDTLSLKVLAAQTPAQESVILKLANLDSITVSAEKDPAAASFMVGTTEFNVPLTQNIDVKAEIERLEKELDYLRGFLASVMKKLSNERFVNNAPANVVEVERQKQADAETKIKNIEQTLAALKA